MHVEDVVVVGLADSVGRHAAIGAVVGLVEVLDVQVGAGDHGVRRHVLFYPQPGDLMGAEESQDQRVSRACQRARRTLGFLAALWATMKVSSGC